MSEIKGKIAVITGASRGIGAATAKQLARAGARVALLARTQADLEKVAKEIRQNGGEAHVFPADLGSFEGIKAVVAQIQSSLGDPDILVNNAGLGRWLYVEETPHEEGEMMMQLPFMCAFHMTRAFLPAMLARRSGHIANINSPIAIISWPGAALYGSSRWALRGFSESLKMDLHGTGVNISHIVLGKVSSNYFEANEGATERLPTINKWIPEQTPEQAAVHIEKAIRHNRKEYMAPFILRVFRFFYRITPGLVKLIIRKTGYKRP